MLICSSPQLERHLAALLARQTHRQFVARDLNASVGVALSAALTLVDSVASCASWRRFTHCTHWKTVGLEQLRATVAKLRMWAITQPSTLCEPLAPRKMAIGTMAVQDRFPRNPVAKQAVGDYKLAAGPFP